MIAKLCVWGEDRNVAIGGMANALDDFEINGVEQQSAVLSAVMEHKRFRDGRVTTAFIAEEFPSGFSGVEASVSELPPGLQRSRRR